MVLQRIQLIIPAMGGEKLLMGALPEYFAVRQDDDIVRVLDGGETVGHDEHGAHAPHLFEGVLNLSLIHISDLRRSRRWETGRCRAAPAPGPSRCPQ